MDFTNPQTMRDYFFIKNGLKNWFKLKWPTQHDSNVQSLELRRICGSWNVIL